VTTAYSNTNGTAAEVLLTWNLFDGFGDQARERQFAEQVNAAKDQRDKACRDTRQTLLIAYNDLGKLTEQMQYLSLHESATAKALTAYRLQFSIGQRTLLSLLDTGNELFQARRAVANARHDLHFAYARTQAGVGNLLHALELTSLEAEPPAIAAGSDGPSECPPQTVGTFVSNKEALIARAALMLAQAAPVGVRAATIPIVVPAVSAALSALVAPQRAVTEKVGVAAVKEALEAWRSAWAELNVGAYLDAYSPGFVPARGVSRAAWEANRRSTLGRANDVSINFEDVAVQLQDDGHATATFRQVYRSASYRDQITKSMRWERLGKRWLIVGETASESR
jgi:adhesin transport system outer membrane protein